MRASPALQEADIVVVGSGTNGLVLANYLARAGLEVAVVERARTIGGGLSTEEITLPLFKHNLHAFFMRWTPNYRLWTDLELGSTGVRMILPERQNALPTSEGRVLWATTTPSGRSSRSPSSPLRMRRALRRFSANRND